MHVTLFHKIHCKNYRAGQAGRNFLSKIPYIRELLSMNRMKNEIDRLTIVTQREKMRENLLRAVN